jgi:hypothetical protein
MDFPRLPDKVVLPLSSPPELRDEPMTARIVPWWKAICLSLITIYILITDPHPFRYFKKHTIEEKAIKILTENPLIGLSLPFLLLRDKSVDRWTIQMATTIS